MADSFLNPDSIITDLNIKPGAKIADFGSGSGYFGLLLATAVGPDGLVTAVDVLQNKLDTLRTAAQARQLFNINYVRGDLEVLGSSQLKDASQDMVLLANILFQSQKKAEILKEAARVLKPGGELVLVDWDPKSPFGPKDGGWKFSKEEGGTLAGQLGFSLVREIPVASNHWGLVLKKTK